MLNRAEMNRKNRNYLKRKKKQTRNYLKVVLENPG